MKFNDDVYPTSDPSYVEEMVRNVSEFIDGASGPVFVLSFVPEALDRLRELNPNAVTALNVYQDEVETPNRIRALKKDYGFDIMNPPYDQANRPGAIDRIHECDLLTFPWPWHETFAEEDRITEELFLNGADGVIPNRFRQAIETRERLRLL